VSVDGGVVARRQRDEAEQGGGEPHRDGGPDRRAHGDGLLGVGPGLVEPAPVRGHQPAGVEQQRTVELVSGQLGRAQPLLGGLLRDRPPAGAALELGEGEEHQRARPVLPQLGEPAVLGVQRASGLVLLVGPRVQQPEHRVRARLLRRVAAPARVPVRPREQVGA
jgi:hypothetical protein